MSNEFRTSNMMSKRKFYVMFYLYFTHSIHLTNMKQSQNDAATFREIFLGRCLYYINVIQMANDDFNGSQYDCGAIWQAFYTAATSKPCTDDDYNEFLNLTDQMIPPNRSLFFSGTLDAAKACKYFVLKINNFD
jgi:hypothetical protein